MSPGSYLVAPEQAPELAIPSSSSTVDVRIIDSTARGKGPSQVLLQPVLPGQEVFEFPCFAFLISHTQGDQTKHVLFDLGVRKDWKEALPSAVSERLAKIFQAHVEKNVAEILDEDVGNIGVKSKDIGAVIWSHHHWDHVGDISTFPSSTELVIGPGFSAHYLPGYPKNKESTLLETDFEGRNVREIGFQSFSSKLGQFPAFDYFGDGSLYLLSSPGHTVGHMCALARVTSSPDTFIFMGGDCAHHGGEFRPTPYLPLPETIKPSPFPHLSSGGCPGALLQKLHPKHSATEPFYTPSPQISENHDEALRSIRKLEEFDASDNVLMCIAHDFTLPGRVEFYPEKINVWKEKGYKEKVRWAFTEGLKID